jgi:hypothetical protein
MNDRSLKAREIEALTFIYAVQPRPPAAGSARSRPRPWRILAGVAGAVLLVAAAWLLLPH